MASACVEIKTTRAISAQLIRHRSFSFQEFSQRYATQATPPSIPQMRMAGSTNRQSSIEVDDLHNLDQWQIEAMVKLQEAIKVSYDAYISLIGAGFATETARMALPLCTETHLYMSGTIRSWLHYLELRTQTDTQAEHRMLANSIKAVLAQKIPNILKLIEEQNAKNG